MHEVSLMQNMLTIVEEAASRENAGRVDSIHLRIGEMAGINIDSLRFAFDVLSKESVAAGAELDIEAVKLEMHCRRCGKSHNPGEFSFKCPDCGGTDLDIVSGREMEIDYISIDDEGKDRAEKTEG